MKRKTKSPLKIAVTFCFALENDVAKRAQMLQIILYEEEARRPVDR